MSENPSPLRRIVENLVVSFLTLVIFFVIVLPALPVIAVLIAPKDSLSKMAMEAARIVAFTVAGFWALLRYYWAWEPRS